MGLMLLPLVVSAVQLLAVRGQLHPTSDMAATELTTRDVGRRMVLLGPFSRDGWHHPGPLSSYLYAVPYRLLGSTAAAMSIAALLVNGAALAGMAVVARRRGGTPLALATLIVGALLIRSLGPDVVRVPWNPLVTVLPYGLLVFLTWALLCRDRWALPFAVLVASFVAQTHVGYVALGLPLLAVGTIGLVVGTLRGEPGGPDGAWTARLRPLVRPGAVAAAVGAVVWAPPIYEQLTHEPGNLGAIAQWFRSGGGDGEPSRGVGVGWRLVAGQYELLPEWLGGGREPGIFTGEPRIVETGVLPVLLPLVVLALAWMVHRRVAGALGLGIAWLAASIAGIVATARVIGPVYAYRTGWSLVLGGVGGLVVLWAAGREVGARAPVAARRAAAPAALVVLAALGVTSAVTYARADVPQAELAAQIHGVTPDVLAGLPPGDDPVVVDGRTGWGGLIQAPGLVLELERHGIDARLPAGEGVGSHRIDDGGPVRARLVVATGAAIAPAADVDGRTLVAYDGEITLDQVRSAVARGDTVPDDDAMAVFLVDP